MIRLLLLLSMAAAACFADAPPVPAYFTVPSQFQVKPGWNEEDYGQAEFPILGQDKVIKTGKHWEAGYIFSGAPDGADADALWKEHMKPMLVRSGWTFFRDEPGQAKTGRYQKDGHDSWMVLWAFAPDDYRLDLVEVGPCPIHLTLNKPAAKPEKVTEESGDFPYLAPLPGSTPRGGSHDDSQMIVTVDTAKDQSEDQVAGTGSITKGYGTPPGMQSPLMFATVYHEALTKAGWTVVHDVHGGADAVVIAHYSANGRNIWAYLHGGGDGYTMQVADTGTEDIGKQLDKECHVALYGINFDFNKSTLRPDSAPVLEQVLALMSSRPDLKLEIQGHTDNVGSDDYNQKLSESRAKAVVAWLQGKGIAGDRLSAQGYGMKQPIADNGSDEGRAKNRRVELKKQGCGT